MAATAPSGTASDGRRVCLFAHFDPQGRLWPHVRHYLGALRGCGFDVVLVQAGVALRPDARAVAADLGVRVIERPNGGLDFASWAHALHLVQAEGGLRDATALLLANDSVYGPFGPLKPIVDAMLASPVDVWGMTDSREKSWHLQSWFLLLSRRAFTSDAFAEVMAMPFESLDKRTIIAQAECGLSARLTEAGMRLAAWAPVDCHVLWRGLTPHNPTHIPWRFMLEDAGVPFVKVELLRDNPLNVRSAVGWRRVVEHLAPPAVGDLDAHLRARRPDRATAAGYVTPLDAISLRRRIYRMVVQVSARVAWRLFGRRRAALVRGTR